MRKKTKSKPIIKRTVKKPIKSVKQVKRKSVKKLPQKGKVRKPTVKKLTKSNTRKRSVTIIRGAKDKRDTPQFKKGTKKILAKVTNRINARTKAEEKERERKRREKAKRKVKKDVKLAKQKSDTKKKESSRKTKKKGRKSPYQSIINLAKKRKLTSKQKATLRKFRKNLTNRKYRWRQKLKKAKTKSERLKINKQILEISVAIRAINVGLGIKKKAKKVPEKKFEKKKVDKKVIQKSTIPVWEGREKLADLIKGGFYKEIVIRGERFKKNQVADMYVAFSDLEDFAYSFGITTPHIIVLERITDKIAEFDVYDYEE